MCLLLIVSDVGDSRQVHMHIHIPFSLEYVGVYLCFGVVSFMCFG